MKMLLWLVAVAFLAGDGTSMPRAAVADETSKVSITAPIAHPEVGPNRGTDVESTGRMAGVRLR